MAIFEWQVAVLEWSVSLPECQVAVYGRRVAMLGWQVVLWSPAMVHPSIAALLASTRAVNNGVLKSAVA